jgi:hypothetical protein
MDTQYHGANMSIQNIIDGLQTSLTKKQHVSVKTSDDTFLNFDNYEIPHGSFTSYDMHITIRSSFCISDLEEIWVDEKYKQAKLDHMVRDRTRTIISFIYGDVINDMENLIEILYEPPKHHISAPYPISKVYDLENKLKTVHEALHAMISKYSGDNL